MSNHILEKYIDDVMAEKRMVKRMQEVVKMMQEVVKMMQEVVKAMVKQLYLKMN
jgi:hypothetical protein